MTNPTKTRRRFTAQQKAEVVALCLREGLSCTAVAQRLGLPNSSLAKWVRQPHQVVLEHHSPIEHFNAELHGLAQLLGLTGRIPSHRQVAGQRNVLNVAAILAVNRDAVVAERN